MRITYTIDTLIIFALNLIISFAYAQAPSVEVWDRRFGGTSRDLLNTFQLTADNGYILGGTSRSDISGEKTQHNWDSTLATGDYWVVKVDSNGNKQWDKRFGGRGDEELYAIQQTADKGYILGGIGGGNISGDITQTGRGNGDFWVVKIDSAGNKQWDKRFGGTLDDYLYSLARTKDGGYILGGSSNSPISGDKSQPDWDNTGFDDDYWVVKIDSNGNKQWDKRFGGIKQDGLVGVKQTFDGGYILGGSTSSGKGDDISDTSFGDFDYWIVKTDSLGNKQWDKRYGGFSNDILESLALTTDSGYVLAGISGGPAEGNKTSVGCAYNDYWLVKVNSLGIIEWDKSYGGLGDDDIESVMQTHDKGFLMAGFSNSLPSCDKTEHNLNENQTWIVKTDSLGNKQWDKTIFTNNTSTIGDLNGYAIEIPDGCYVIANSTNGGVAGYKTQPAWDNVADYWIMKFCFTGIPEGIETLTNKQLLNVYPNPFATDVTITLAAPNLTEADFSICNAAGQTIYTRHETNLSPAYTKMLDLSYLPNGVYMLTIEVDGEKTTKEIVKQ